jgi:DNA polymerase-1
MAINHPVQGTAADLMKMAMVAISLKLPEKDARVLLQVHDELVFEVKENSVDEVSKIIKDAMENVVKLRVPVVVEVNAANNWGEVK